MTKYGIFKSWEDGSNGDFTEEKIASAELNDVLDVELNELVNELVSWAYEDTGWGPEDEIKKKVETKIETDRITLLFSPDHWEKYSIVVRTDDDTKIGEIYKGNLFWDED